MCTISRPACVLSNFSVARSWPYIGCDDVCGMDRGFEMMMTDRTNPHDITQATIAWFRYHLMGDEAHRSWSYGADCRLCNHSNWSVQRKGMD